MHILNPLMEKGVLFRCVKELELWARGACRASPVKRRHNFLHSKEDKILGTARGKRSFAGFQLRPLNAVGI